VNTVGVDLGGNWSKRRKPMHESNKVVKGFGRPRGRIQGKGKEKEKFRKGGRTAWWPLCNDWKMGVVRGECRGQGGCYRVFVGEVHKLGGKEMINVW